MPIRSQLSFGPRASLIKSRAAGRFFSRWSYGTPLALPEVKTEEGGSSDERDGHDHASDDEQAGGAQNGIARSSPQWQHRRGFLFLQAPRLAPRPCRTSGEGAVRGAQAAAVGPSHLTLPGPAALSNGLSGRRVGRKRGGAQGVPTVSSFRRVSRTPYHSETGRPGLLQNGPLSERDLRARDLRSWPKDPSVRRPSHGPSTSPRARAIFSPGSHDRFA